MNLNKAFFLRQEDVIPKWRLIDATNKVLGRLATEVANILRGKIYSNFTHHVDSGDYVVIINADKIKLTGNKWNNKIYIRTSGYLGNNKEIKAKDLLQKHPTDIIKLAVRRMLPKNILSRAILKKLKIYAGATHVHSAQLKTKI